MEFTRTIHRTKTFKSSARGLPSRQFKFSIGPHGISVREKGQGEAMSFSWLDIVGLALVHGKRSRPC